MKYLDSINEFEGDSYQQVDCLRHQVESKFQIKRIPLEKKEIERLSTDIKSVFKKSNILSEESSIVMIFHYSGYKNPYKYPIRLIITKYEDGWYFADDNRRRWLIDQESGLKDFLIYFKKEMDEIYD